MATRDEGGALSALWRFPVKSMGGESLLDAELTPRGLAGDRSYALVDAATGRVINAKSGRPFGELLECRAAFVAPPRVGHELPPVQVMLPDGTTTDSTATDVDHVLSNWFGHGVRLTRWRGDIARPGAAAFLAKAALPEPRGVGSFVDLFPVSLLTTSTLARLSALQPASRFDERRFRMNLIVRTPEHGFVENG